MGLRFAGAAAPTGARVGQASLPVWGGPYSPASAGRHMNSRGREPPEMGHLKARAPKGRQAEHPHTLRKSLFSAPPRFVWVTSRPHRAAA